MNEASAKEVLLLQAYESVQPASPHWGDDDRAWATRLALQDVPAGAADSADGFLARRARHAMQRLQSREPGVGRWLSLGIWRPRVVVWAVAAGALLGLLADSIGSSQRINLLAPPVWGVIAWNLCIYAGLILSALRGRTQVARPSALVRWTERLMRLRWPGLLPDGVQAPSGSATAADDASALRRFSAAWLCAMAPLAGRRAAMLLHAGAAALGAGLVMGLYGRGLVLDYRAAWESTFLSAESVQWWLTHLLGPASWLSGIALPDTAGVAALRVAHGSEMPGAPAAAWIHLYGLTLACAVVLPRSLLALASAWQARRLAADFPLPLADPYFTRLLNLRSGDQAHVQVLPYAKTPSAAAITSLRRMLAEVLGEGMRCEVAATTAFGDEDERASRRLPADITLAIALFDLAATPEPEHHGAFFQAIATRAPPGAAILLWVDETAFRQRFGSTGTRLVERRATWAAMAAAHDTAAVFTDLTASGASSAAALQAALAGSSTGRRAA